MRILTSTALLVACVALVACDMSGPTENKELIAEVRYRTPFSDGATAATQGPNGAIVVTGLTDGRIGQGDWTNGFPLVLRVQPDGSIVDTTVYRDIRYGSALDAAPLDDGLAVLVERQNYDRTGVEPKALTLYRTSPDGTRRDTLYRPDSTFAGENPLHHTADGGFLLLAGRTGENDVDLVKLERSGRVDWTYRMPGVQFVSAVAEAANGGVFVAGQKTSRQFALVRLTPGGDAQWRRTYGSDRSDAPFRNVRSMIADGNEAVVLGTRKPTNDGNPRTRSVVLTRVDSTGGVANEQSYATGPVEASTLTQLPGDRLALSYTENYGAPGDVGKTRAFVLYLRADGAVQRRFRVGPRQGTTRVQSLLPLSSKHLAVICSTGPEAIGGYGGNDLDVLITTFRTE